MQQGHNGVRITADTFRAALSLIHQVLLDKFQGEAVLLQNADKLVRQAGGIK